MSSNGVGGLIGRLMVAGMLPWDVIVLCIVCHVLYDYVLRIYV